MLLGSIDRLRALPRLLEIARTLVHFGLHDLLHSVGAHRLLDGTGAALGWKADKALAGKPLPERLRLALEALGPAFVKLGQILASRVDLLGPEWVASLDKLHDQAAPVPFEAIEAQLRADLGTPIEEAFVDFGRAACAAGSVAQVHRATLAGNGPVAVKVRRPGVGAVIESDMLLLETLAEWWEQEDPASRRYQPSEIVRQLRKSLARELDFGVEARSQQRFAESFAGDPGVVVPRVHAQFTRESLLVMDWVEGVPGTDLPRLDAEGFDRQRLAASHVDMILKMVLEDGLFHADPHAGNVFMLRGNRIALIDFGMIGWLSARRRDQLLDLLSALVMRHPESMRDVLLEWSDGANVSSERFAEDLGRLLHLYEHAQLTEVRLGTLLSEIAGIMREHHLAMPPDLALLFKALITLEGFGTRLVPQFKLIEHVGPRIERLMHERWEPRHVARRVAVSANAWGRVLHAGPRILESLVRRFADEGVAMSFEVRELEAFGRRVERTLNRATLGLVTAALIVGSSIMIAAGRESPALTFFGFGGIGVSLVIGLWLIASIRRSR